MAKKIKDTDYLFLSARIRCMENSLLTRERMEQMLEARTDEDAVKVLQECGYRSFSLDRPEELDHVLVEAREAMLEDILCGMPDPRYLDVFKLKYDYHNVKALLKAAAVNTDAESMLMDMGRVPAAELKQAVDSEELDDLPGRLAEAVREAQDVLNTTRDPQLSDIVLDRWCYQDMMDTAKDTGSRFLEGYVRAGIDAANLRALVRTLRMGKNADFLKGVLFEDGTVDAGRLLEVAADGGRGLEELYASTGFRAAAEAGAAALKGGALTEFEKQCDDAVTSYLASASFVPFGEAPLVGYLAARETEYTNLRILLLGRKVGLAPDVIRSRLRASHL